MDLMPKTSMSTLAESALQARLREKLNAEGVKLWQEPFFNEEESSVNDTETMALASRYSTEMSLDVSDVVSALTTLQSNAIERLTERDLYKTTGLATLRIKGPTVQKLQIGLGISGKELRSTVAQIMNVSKERIKLISSGKVIKDDQSLDGQGVKNGGSILVVVVGGEAATKGGNVEESVFKELDDIKSSADYLAGREAGGLYGLQVADQTGKALELPDSEKRSLAISLALHDKGRGALKRKTFAKALVYLLEADSVYSQCQSNLLEMVDNYGLLNLDIAWCYLCLQSISDLPAVEARLLRCEKSLQRSYGENLERVIALKGSTGFESALFVRLHLLQGIAAYHLGQMEKSKFYVSKADSEISRLQISDEQLVELINMGYDAGESRMALRATFGNIAASVDWIIKKKDETKKIKDQEKQDSKRRKLQKRLGNCTNGEPVNVALFRNLKEMGFDVVLAKEALKQSNNDINTALQMVNDDHFISSVISQPGPSSSAPTNSATTAAAATTAAVPNPSVSQSSLDMLVSSIEDLTAEETEKSHKALETLSKDVFSESEYIDLSLEDETLFLNQYKELLRM